MSFQNHNDRRETADAAKKAMLEKFKNKAAPAAVDPAEAAARVKAAEEKEAKRVEAEKKRRERVELEKMERKIAAEHAAKVAREKAAREAHEAAKRRRAEAEAAEVRKFEDEARRDLAAAGSRKRR